MTTSERTTVRQLYPAPSVRFEPCLVFHDDGNDVGVCASCGWTSDEHEVELHAA